MIKREKTLVAPAPYQVTFETCVRSIEQFRLRNSWGVKVYFRIAGANSQTGTISARIDNVWRLDAIISGNDQQSMVQVTIMSIAGMVDTLGFVARAVDDFFELFFQNITPLMGNVAAMQSLNTSQMALPSDRYSSNQVRYRLSETPAGSVFRWVWFILFILIVLSCIGSLLQAAQNGR